MPRKFYIQTRLYNVNDRLASLYLCEKVDEMIDQNILPDFEHCYLPYRDSDAQLTGNEPDPGKAIFDLDVGTLMKCAGVIGNYDGVGYDSGCGFEIGLAYAWGRPINLISTDFMKWNVDFYGKEKNDKFYTGSKLLQHVAKVVSITEDDKTIEDYRRQQEDLRDRNIEAFKKNLIEDFKENKEPVLLKPDKFEYDLFIGPSFFSTIVQEKMWIKLADQCNQENISHVEADRTNPEDMINKLRKSRVAVFYGDMFEHPIDSCILQGIAYGLNIPVIMVCGGHAVYNDGRLQGRKNVMITQSTNTMVPTIDRVIDAYKEIDTWREK